MNVTKQTTMICINGKCKQFTRTNVSNYRHCNKVYSNFLDKIKHSKTKSKSKIKSKTKSKTKSKSKSKSKTKSKTNSKSKSKSKKSKRKKSTSTFR